MQALLLFLLVAVISFAGSLQAGLVNVSVLQIALKKGFSSALWLAIGGCLPELLYAALAIFAGMFVEQHANLMNNLGLVTMPVFACFGIFQLYRKKSNVLPDRLSQTIHSEFWHGLGLAFLNPQLLPFWFGVYVYVNSSIMAVDNLLKKIAFIAGTAFGALVLLVLLAWIAVKNREIVEKWFTKYDFNKLTGWLFIGLACWKAVSVLIKYI